MESAGGDTDAPVPRARWQKGEDSMGFVRGKFCHANGFADAAVVIKGIGAKKRDIDDLFSCSHNLL